MYGDLGRACQNISKFSERKFSKCPRCTGCTVILVAPLEMIPSSRKDDNYSDILEMKNTLSARGVLGVLYSDFGRAP